MSQTIVNLAQFLGKLQGQRCPCSSATEVVISKEMTTLADILRHGAFMAEWEVNDLLDAYYEAAEEAARVTCEGAVADWGDS